MNSLVPVAGATAFPKARSLRIVRTMAVLLICSAWNGFSFAHDVDVTGVARLFLEETGGSRYQLVVVDPQAPPIYNLADVIPDRCATSNETGTEYGYAFTCPSALTAGDMLTLPWLLEGVVVLARWSDGSSRSAWFPDNGTEIEVDIAGLTTDSLISSAFASLGSLAATYTLLGIEHILFGVDHLLFVLGLLMLFQGFWKLVQTITAFTIAHSITLAFATMGFLPVPGAPIEVIIALSIVLLAREVIMGQRGHRHLVHYQPWLVAFVFGLFHGFGFAGALSELGLWEQDVPLALLFFNIGVETGQLLFIAAVLGTSYALRGYLQGPAKNTVPAVKTATAYGLGGVAMFWFFERLPSLWIA
ncbi:MAG: HupE/UreJ family protein [Pseudohongiellaceae bacterium]